MNHTPCQHTHDSPTCLARHVAVLGWFLGMMWLLGHNRYQSFIHPDFKILLLLAMNGTFVFMLAICSKASKHHENCDHDHGHSSRFKQWLTAGWVLLPIWFAVAGFSGQSLNADAFAKRRVQAMPAQTNSDTNHVPTTELAIEPEAFRPEEHMQISSPEDKQTSSDSEIHVTLLKISTSEDSLLGQQITTVGRAYRGADIPIGHISIFRFVITCCAADAQPVGMLVQTDTKNLPESDQWVQVQGKLELHQVDGRDQFVIVATSITVIDPPQSPYLQAQW